MKIEFVSMPRSVCHGSSIIAARKYLPGEFLLVAADHVFDPKLVRAIANTSLTGEQAGCVLLERNLKLYRER